LQGVRQRLYTVVTAKARSIVRASGRVVRLSPSVQAVEKQTVPHCTSLLYRLYLTAVQMSDWAQYDSIIGRLVILGTKTKLIPWPESASELY
jgi:hypothetical protein